MMKARRRFVLLMLLAACAVNAFGQRPGGQNLRRLSWPGKDWSLDVSLTDFNVPTEDFLRDEQAYWLFATVRATGDKSTPRPVMLRIRLEPAKFPGSDRELRDRQAKKLMKAEGMSGGNVKNFEHNQIPGIRYTMEFAARSLYYPYAVPLGPKMRGMDAFIIRDDVWITFSIHALSLSKAEEQLFYSLLDSVTFTDTSNPTSSFDHYYKAKSLLRQKQYQQAAAHLDTALGLEQARRQLDDEHWRNLVGHLVDLHTAAGDKMRVRELFDYGIGHDPTFPVFHLALAQHHASLGDVDATIASLEKAYLHRKSDRRTAFWIDPMAYPAFEPFRKNEKFRKAIKAMKK